METTGYRLVIAVIMVIFCDFSVTADPDMLQDVCVANLDSDITMNGFACKHYASPDDFFYDGLSYPRPIENIYGATATMATVQNITGLNTLGMAISRIDFGPGGLNPPHLHPRSAEIFYLQEGNLDISFITTDNKLYTKSIEAGQLFVYPKGLIHFQINTDQNARSVAIAFFNSQMPGIQRVGNALFESSPSVPDYVLARTFLMDLKDVKKIKSLFSALE